MKVYLGADHRGYELKEFLLNNLRGFEVHDLGALAYVPTDDFVEFAVLVGQKVVEDKDALGIVICGSGAGVCITANKIAGIRSSVCQSMEQVRSAREDDDLNILALASDFVTKEAALEIAKTFLTTEFIPESRFLRRIAKITELEKHA